MQIVFLFLLALLYSRPAFAHSGTELIGVVVLFWAGIVLGTFYFLPWSFVYLITPRKERGDPDNVKLRHHAGLAGVFCVVGFGGLLYFLNAK